mmetsp:Transcript_18331/g.41735  ORF Transcript_18331/g.41735 Transcript_18331/m.41735 type:complete len:201 (+) Transcript_18331:24-626(+)
MAASKKDFLEEYEPLYKECGAQIGTGVGAGFLYGWMKGLRENQHLAGKYSRDSVYRGVITVFRVPANFVPASLQGATWAGHIGAVAASFGFLQLYFELERRKANSALAEAADRRSAQEAHKYSMAGLLIRSVEPSMLSSPYSQVAPAVTAGLIVGSYCGFARQRGLKGIVVGSVVGFGIPVVIKTLEVYSKLKLDELVSA